MNENNTTEIYQCLTCNVEISKRLYETSEKEKQGHEHFKITLKETQKPSWTPYYPYQKLRRKKLLEEFQLVPARCTIQDAAINLDMVYPDPAYPAYTTRCLQ